MIQTHYSHTKDEVGSCHPRHWSFGIWRPCWRSQNAAAFPKRPRRLFLTQSALSHQLKALESHYGAALVEKNVRPLRFTAIGQRLLALARAVLPQVAEAGRDVARLAQGHAGPLRVAVQCHNCFDWLMPAMDAYRSLWPEVELDIISGFVVDPLPLIRPR